MSTVRIDIDGLSKRFKNVHALTDVSMRFETGGLYGVIGPAGAGKTTLFRLICALMHSDAGAVRYSIDGRDMSFTDFSENIAYMPQSQSLYADLSVDEHLEFFKKLYGIDDAEFAQRRSALAHLTRMDKFMDRPAGHLSGGMYKKLGLMCALLRAPKVMLLDEPTNGVDPISRREFWNLLHASLARGILVIISTAYMDEAERCSEVILMDSGRVLASGEPAALLSRYGAANFDEFFLKRGAEN